MTKKQNKLYFVNWNQNIHTSRRNTVGHWTLPD